MRLTGQLKALSESEVIIRAREVAHGSTDYPARLEILPDPPKKLYVCGGLPSSPLVAIVGSRAADTSACRFARRLTMDLAERGIGIVSGGALGIDTAAHQGALDAGGITVSIIGSGFDYLYPSANRDLFARISGSGALLTEFPPEQPPTKWTFPKRNRIIVALASAVVVVQAAERSGALITARWARELGVPLGAVPGLPGDPRNAGNHALLRQGAAMIENANHIVELMKRDQPPLQLCLPKTSSKASAEVAKVNLDLDPETRKVLDFLGASPLHIDEISTGTGIPPSLANAAIMALEIEGLVEDRGGRNYIKVG